MRIIFLALLLISPLLSFASDCPTIDTLKTWESKELIFYLKSEPVINCLSVDDHRVAILDRINPLLYKREFDNVNEILNIMESFVGSDSSFLFRIELLRGNLYYMQDENKKALHHYKISNSLIPNDSLFIKNSITSLKNLSNIEAELYNFDKSLSSG